MKEENLNVIIVFLQEEPFNAVTCCEKATLK